MEIPHLLQFGSGRLVFPCKKCVDASKGNRNACCLYRNLVQKWHTNSFGNCSAYFSGLHSAFVTGKIRKSLFSRILKGKLLPSHKSQYFKRFDPDCNDSPQFQINNGSKTWDCYRFAGSRRIQFALQVNKKDTSNKWAITHLVEELAARKYPQHKCTLWNGAGEPLQWKSTVEIVAGDWKKRTPQIVLSCKKVLSALQKENFLTSENDSADIKWLSNVTLYMESNTSQWYCPLIASRALLDKTSVSVDSSKIVFSVDFSIYFGRLLFYLIASEKIAAILDPLERNWEKDIPLKKKNLTTDKGTEAEVEKQEKEQKPVFLRSMSLSDDEFSVTSIMQRIESTGYAQASQPAGLKMKMKDYQLQTLQWMLDQESKPEGINGYFWKELQWDNCSQPFYYSKVLGELRIEKPPLVRGGLLCEEMGLGKTLECIALVLASRQKSEVERRSAIPAVPVPDPVRRLIPPGGTLVIAPTTLLHQWKSEIAKSLTDPCSLDVLVFIGKKKWQRLGPDLVEKLARADIVVTNYSTVAKDISLQKVAWERVCVDEMQEIRRSTTAVARLCKTLVCKTRWMISGTPLYTGVDDLNGELEFLGVIPFSLPDKVDGFWGHKISQPMLQKHKGALQILEALMSRIMMRHSKGQHYVNDSGRSLLMLPPIKQCNIPIQYEKHSAESACYALLEGFCSRVIRKLVSNKATIDSKNEVFITTAISVVDILRLSTISMCGLTGGNGFPSAISRLAHMSRQVINPSASNSKKSSPASFYFYHRLMTPELLRDHLLTLSIRDPKSTKQNASNDTTRRRYANTAAGGAGAAARSAMEHVEYRFNEANTKLKAAETLISSGRRKRAKLRWRWLLRVITSGAYFSVLMMRYGRSEFSKILSHTAVLGARGCRILNLVNQIKGFRKTLDSEEQRLREKSPEELLKKTRNGV